MIGTITSAILGAISVTLVAAAVSGFQGCSCGAPELNLETGTFGRDTSSNLGYPSQESGYQLIISSDLKSAHETYVRNGTSYETFYTITEKQ